MYIEIEDGICEINNQIQSYSEKNSPGDILVYTYLDYDVWYHLGYTKDKVTGLLIIDDRLSVYQNNKLIISHKPSFHGYISYDDNIIVMSSNGEIWIYDIENNIESTFHPNIDIFDQRVEKEDGLLYTVNEEHMRIPVKSNRITIGGCGRPWGEEPKKIYFILTLDKDLSTIKYVDSRANAYDI